MKRFILILLAFFPALLSAQGVKNMTYKLAQPDSVYGARTSVSEKGMAQILVQRLDKPVAGQVVKGHRVCIFMEKSQNARGNAFEAEAKFRQHYPDVATYVQYDKTSYWKVLVGNCLTVDEVTMLKAKAERIFPAKPFIVQEDIPVSEFGKPGRSIASEQYLRSGRQPAEETEQQAQAALNQN